jgi:phage shock protein E
MHISNSPELVADDHAVFAASATAHTQPLRQKRLNMAYTEKFQHLADTACSQVQGVAPDAVGALMADGAVALDIRDPDEHAAGHIDGSINISRGKLEMLVEEAIPDLDIVVLCYCNAVNRGALSAASLKAMGYRNAAYVDGGLNGYRQLGES